MSEGSKGGQPRADDGGDAASKTIGQDTTDKRPDKRLASSLNRGENRWHGRGHRVRAFGDNKEGNNEKFEIEREVHRRE